MMTPPSSFSEHPKAPLSILVMGGDGAGKTTVATLISLMLRSAGFTHVDFYNLAGNTLSEAELNVLWSEMHVSAPSFLDKQIDVLEISLPRHGRTPDHPTPVELYRQLQPWMSLDRLTVGLTYPVQGSCASNDDAAIDPSLGTDS